MATNSFMAWVDSWKKEIEAKIRKAYQEAEDKAWEEYFYELEKIAKEIFTKSIDNYYASYSPTTYNRNYSLYNLIHIERGNDYIEIWFEPDDMTTYRNGYSGEDGLYNSVFRMGWHGGADKGNYTHLSNGRVLRTPHPNPGTPYWREPEPYYTSWGKSSVITESPLDEIKRSVEDFNKNENQKLFDSILNRNLENIKIDL